MKQRIGVYVCHCGGNISDYVDVKEVVKQSKLEGEVVLAKDTMFACSDSGQNEMIDDIKEQKLDAIIVASCSPKLHLHTFRNVAIRAGINPYNYVQVNIREQCSWAHSDKKKEATIKGIGLVKAGIKRVAHSQELEKLKVDVRKSAIILGAGIAGMKAAISLAKMGNEVFLIERDFFIGGRVAQAGELFISHQNGKEVIAELYEELRKFNNITLFTGATLSKKSGSLGNFEVEIKIRPRYITKESQGEDFTQVMKDCPVTIPCMFDYGLTKKKAVFTKYDGAIPNIPVVDKEAIKNEKAFLRSYSHFIDLNQEPEFINLKAGAILVATGFDPYLPHKDEYGWWENPCVITFPKFKRLLEQSNGKIVYNHREIKSIAYIYCVGSRQTKGTNRYCSRFCCTAAIHSSVQLHEKFEGIQAYHLYRDIRTYGKQEVIYEESCKLGDIYLQYHENEPPVVKRCEKNTIITVKDELTEGEELELEADLVVLVTGMTAREDSNDIAEILKIPTGTDRFFNEIHPKLRPVETVINGVLIGGTCQGPKSISSSVQSSMSAVAKINAILKKGFVELEPIVAKINHDACVWCGKCAEVCEFDAIKKITKGSKEVAEVNESTCTGCSVCAPVCPEDAIQITNFTDNEIMGMIEGFMTEIVSDGSEKETEETKEEIKQDTLMKEFPKTWYSILDAIKEDAKSIPQISDELGLKNHEVTYDIMTMDKYGILQPAGMDDMDEYFLYKAK
ncbi:MAG: CoB--CoM heterodisulfide reductase iron-sulfur subunit A family protein [Bacteroidota bacterium]